jgi:hypothetical protein
MADHWSWAIDTVIPMRDQDSRGFGRDRRRMKPFRATWELFAADQANLFEFLEAKRRRR